MASKKLSDYLFHEEPGITLYCGDAREVMPLLIFGRCPVCADDVQTFRHASCGNCGKAWYRPCRADALVTDPPYGIGWTRGAWTDSAEEYPGFIKWLSLEAAATIDGWCFVFQSMLNVGHFHEWFPDGWRIFAACKNFAQIRPTGVWHSWDPVVFWNNAPNSAPNSGHVNRDYHVGNVAGSFGERSGHPCPRPLDTMKHIVQLAAPEGCEVLDPFAGSGTTLVAAKETRRRAIGIEIEPKYCEIAVKRLRQEVLL